MLQKLRRRFIAVAMSIVLGLELILFLSINGINFLGVKSRADHMLDFLLKFEGVFPIERKFLEEYYWNPELYYTTRYFTVRVTPDNKIAAVDTEHIAAVTPDQAMALSEHIILSSSCYGLNGRYLYKMTQLRQSGVKLLVFLDVGSSLERMSFLLTMTAAILGGFAALTFILLVIFSGRAVRPFVENEKRQQQFIHDAGHELKTPLSIISADVDVLELTSGKNNWTESMRRQIARLKSLIERLLILARYEEMPEGGLVKTDLFSEARTVLSQFDSVLAGKRITLACPREEGAIFLSAKPGAVRDLFFILFDNLAKYAPEGGNAELSVTLEGRFCRLSLKNDAPDFRPGDEKHIFERFYRGDPSRARQTADPGGSGIGLSIAKRIAESSGGSIWAEYSAGTLTINARFPVWNEV